MPFAEYKDFDDCVKKNQDKDDPKAYCAAIKAKTEENVLNVDDIAMQLFGKQYNELTDEQKEEVHRKLKLEQPKPKESFSTFMKEARTYGKI